MQGKTPQAVAAIQTLLNETKKEQYSDQEKAARIPMLNALGTLLDDSGKTQEAVATFRQIAEVEAKLAPSVAGKLIEAYKSAKDYKMARQ